MESESPLKSAAGMALVMKVGNETEFAKPPTGFPQC